MAIRLWQHCLSCRVYYLNVKQYFFISATVRSLFRRLLTADLRHRQAFLKCILIIYHQGPKEVIGDLPSDSIESSVFVSGKIFASLCFGHV